ncbi:MAG: response regulator transcription factor [Anaerolineales bacterium]|nr:response regulator transcription factor [Anaerolineales bacterium]
MSVKRVVIFEDDFLDIEGIKSIISNIPDAVLVGEFSTPREALSRCQQLKPDLLIVDADIHGDKTVGPTFVRNVLKVLPDTRILGMTRYPECISSLKHAGCDIVVNKKILDNLLTAEKYFREALMPPLDYGTDPLPVSLSDEEERVLKYICQGLTEDEITEIMGFSGTRKRVRGIKTSLFNKFGAKNVANLVSNAYERGYLVPGNLYND